MLLTVAIFFASGGDPLQVSARKAKQRQGLAQHARQISLVFRSLRRFHPDARCVLLTDEVTPNDWLKDVSVVRTAVDVRQLVWNRLLAQEQFAETLRNDELCLFLDGDMLINGPLDTLHHAGGDVLLTWRAKEKFINGGFIGIRGGRQAQVRSFFARVKDVFRGQFWHEAAWFGDESALRAAHAGVDVEPETQCRKKFEGYDVTFLPGSVWNWIPEKRVASILQPTREHRILHFVGQRKWLMARYWHLHLAPAREPIRTYYRISTSLHAVREELLPENSPNWLMRRFRKGGASRG